MPWTHTHPMLERARLLADYHDGLFTPAELALRYGVSRKTLYKWLHRYRDEGPDALADRSHTAHHLPHRTPAVVEEALLEIRHKHPTWGPRKLLAYLARRRPELTLPAPSTVGAILKRQGLVEPRRRRRRAVHPGQGPLRTTEPNQLWCADFKGQFLLGNGLYCYPLTVTDAHSRFLLCCHGLQSIAQEGAIPLFDRLFREQGLPGAIRTDNGHPFATQAICGLSKLNVWWIKLGIRHQRIAPGRPEQNGRHERMHRVLKAETTRPPSETMPEQQVRFDAFRHTYNEERPHQALRDVPPASCHRASARTMPERVPQPAYPSHYEVRRVSSCGTVRLKTHQFFVSQALNYEEVAFEEVGDGLWSLYFYEVLLGRVDERDFKLRS